LARSSRRREAFCCRAAMRAKSFLSRLKKPSSNRKYFGLYQVLLILIVALNESS
jgi:hypothetical protein